MKPDLTDGFVYNEGVVRTNVDCTDCKKVFVAKINFDLNGNHQLICPFCGHEHWRVVKNGVVTGDRWGSQNGPNRPVPTERMWSDVSHDIQTTTASKIIRERWFAKDE